MQQHRLILEPAHLVSVTGEEQVCVFVFVHDGPSIEGVDHELVGVGIKGVTTREIPLFPILHCCVEKGSEHLARHVLKGCVYFGHLVTQRIQTLQVWAGEVMKKYLFKHKYLSRLNARPV